MSFSTPKCLNVCSLTTSVSLDPEASSYILPACLNSLRHNSSSNISVSSVTSSRISEMEAEEKSLRDRLIVLEEQKFMVQEMIADANKRRKFDEVAALAGNVEDLSIEIDSVQKMLDGLDWEGAYAAANVAGNGGGGGLGSSTASPVRNSGKAKVVDNG